MDGGRQVVCEYMQELLYLVHHILCIVNTLSQQDDSLVSSLPSLGVVTAGFGVKHQRKCSVYLMKEFTKLSDDGLNNNSNSNNTVNLITSLTLQQNIH